MIHYYVDDVIKELLNQLGLPIPEYSPKVWRSLQDPQNSGNSAVKEEVNCKQSALESDGNVQNSCHVKQEVCPVEDEEVAKDSVATLSNGHSNSRVISSVATGLVAEKTNLKEERGIVDNAHLDTTDKQLENQSHSNNQDLKRPLDESDIISDATAKKARPIQIDVLWLLIFA